jgi:hypothetical protein
MAETLTFSAWQRDTLLDLATGTAAGRLRGALTLQLSDSTGNTSPPDGSPFLIRGARDIAALSPRAIRGVAPRSAVNDAETTKLVHVDFHDAGLPWRYTPRQPAGANPAPWLAVLVGTVAELRVEGTVVASVETSVLREHPLAEAHLWAHVQGQGPAAFSRVLSPAKLRPQQQYVAAVVPAYGPDGEFAWTDAGLSASMPGVLPAFYSWQFATGEEGDFETLAAALRLRPAREIGRAKIRYRRPQVTGIDVTLDVGGAITSLQTPLALIEITALSDEELLGVLRDQHEFLAGADPAAWTPAERRQKLTEFQATVLGRISAARADLDPLSASLAGLDPPVNGFPGRDLIGLPQYGRPWAPDPEATTWGEELNDDPRYRGIAGLGLWLSIQGQEALMAAAVEQAGALLDAGQRAGDLAFGLLAAGSLWQRRLPEDAALQLSLFGATLDRMATPRGDTVLTAVTGETSSLDRALFSSAALRLLRDGTARARHGTVRARDGTVGRVDRVAAWKRANQTPAPDPTPPAGLPHVDAIAAEVGEAPLEERLGLPPWRPELWEVVDKLTGRPIAEIGGELVSILDALGISCEGLIFDILGAATASGIVLADRRLLLEVINRCRAQQAAFPIERDEIELIVGMLSPTPPSRRRPVNLDGLAGAVAAAIDPTLSPAPACRRVASTIEGADACVPYPLEATIRLDFPTWTLLNQYAKEWLLPGAGSLPKHSIVALQTNPVFIDAFMVGINTQFMAEMRWRGLPAERTITPLRMFWGQVHFDTGQRGPDIQPLADWAAAPGSVLGDLRHQVIRAGDTTGKQDLVIALKTPLFRRYPSTVVYLVKPTTQRPLDDILTDTPIFTHSPEPGWREGHECFGPIFRGALEPDLHFFAFDVDPEDLDQYWLVLDEPPSELRFRIDRPGGADGATNAKRRIDQPTRVAISGAELEAQGETG